MKVFGSHSLMIQTARGCGWTHEKSIGSKTELGILALCQQKTGLPCRRFFSCCFWHSLQEEQEQGLKKPHAEPGQRAPRVTLPASHHKTVPSSPFGPPKLGAAQLPRKEIRIFCFPLSPKTDFALKKPSGSAKQRINSSRELPGGNPWVQLDPWQRQRSLRTRQRDSSSRLGGGGKATEPPLGAEPQGIWKGLNKKTQIDSQDLKEPPLTASRRERHVAASGVQQPGAEIWPQSQGQSPSRVLKKICSEKSSRPGRGQLSHPAPAFGQTPRWRAWRPCKASPPLRWASFPCKQPALQQNPVLNPPPAMAGSFWAELLRLHPREKD